jgi:putative ubiquitin-RnfH superfamily antitoxin RatB of RatAB toxin-antitoxin module
VVFSVTLVVSLAPRSTRILQLSVEEGTTASHALRASGLLDTVTQEQLQSLELAIWGRGAPGTQALRPDDRLELVRPLLVDPKIARRERFANQGAKKAGLFKTRRAGGRAGY